MGQKGQQAANCFSMALTWPQLNHCAPFDLALRIIETHLYLQAPLPNCKLEKDQEQLLLHGWHGKADLQWVLLVKLVFKSSWFFA